MANLFAVADPDPELLDWIERVLHETQEFACIWRPAPGWLAASAPLPEGDPDDHITRGRGFAFAEGRDRLEAGADHDHRWLDRVARIADAGPRDLAQLPGDFGFVRFRPDGAAVVVRSRAGHAPFYVYRRGHGWALGTLLNYLTRFLPDRFEPDPLVNLSFSWVNAFIDDRTFLKGVSILPRATRTELRPGHPPATCVYWDPQPPAGHPPKPDPEHARRLRDVLVAALERDLDPGGRNLVALSGGVDSSSVAALAAGVVGRGLSSVSMIPGFEPERSHELSYIEPLVARFGIAPAHVCEWTLRTRMRWAETFPGLPFQVVNPALCELPRISSEQDVRVLVGGEFADEVCGELGRIDDWALHTSLVELVWPGGRPLGSRDYLRWGKRRLLRAVRRPALPFPADLIEGVDPAIAAEYRDWLRRLRARVAKERRPLAELAGRAAQDAWVAMNWEGTTPLGVRRSTPFFSKEVLELAFSCHPRELLGPGTKRLLREALRGDVPERNLSRADKGVGGPRLHGATVELDPDIVASVETLIRPEWRSSPPRRVPYATAEVLTRAAQVVRCLRVER
jgi:asparagine synthetase B (glutamine-hydrolysing)